MYIYIYIHVYIYTYIYMYIYIHIYMYIYNGQIMGISLIIIDYYNDRTKHKIGDIGTN